MRVPYDFDYNDNDDGGGNIGRRGNYYSKSNIPSTSSSSVDSHKDPFQSMFDISNKTSTSTSTSNKRRRKLKEGKYNMKNVRRMFGIGLVKSFIRLDALPFRSWDPVSVFSSFTYSSLSLALSLTPFLSLF